MNCAFTLNDMQYDPRFGKYDSVSVLHALFDGLLQSDLGSQTADALKFFSKMLEITEDRDILDIVNKSLTVDERRERLEILDLFDLNITTKFSNLAEKISINSGKYFDADSHSIYQTKMFLSNYVLDISDIPSQGNSYEERLDRIKRIFQILAQSLRPMVTKFVKLNPSGLISAGWKTHLVGFHYTQIDTDKYRYGFFNSGRGLKMHAKLNGDKYSVCKLFQGSLNDLVEMVAYIHIFRNYLEGTFFLSNHKLFYFCLPQSESQREFYPDFVREMRWITPQLSGTCTYFGFLYAIKYMFYASNRKQNFDTFVHIIEQQSIESIVDYIHNAQRISQKHKIFLDLIVPRISDSYKINELYLRYVKDVSEFTNTTTIDVLEDFSELHFSIYTSLLHHDESFVYPHIDRTIDAYSNLIFLVKKIFLTMKTNFKRRKRLETFEEYIYLTSFLFYIRDISTLSDSAYVLHKDDQFQSVPHILLDMYTQVSILFSEIDEKKVPYAISFLFKIILIRFNENNNKIYFEPSSREYHHQKIYSYYMSLSTLDDKSLHFFTGFLPTKNDYFHLIRDYYDLILSDTYVIDKKDYDEKIIKFKLFDYCKHFSSNLMQNLETPKQIYENFSKINSTIRAVFLIMYNIDSSDIFHSHDKYQIVHSWKTYIYDYIVHIYDLQKPKFDFQKKIVFSASDDLMQINCFFTENRVDELNKFYEENAWILINEKFLSHHRFFVNIDSKDFDIIDSSEKLSTPLDNLVVSDNVVLDYVDYFHKRKSITSALITEDSLQKMFLLLNDTAIIVLLNLIVYYHHDLSNAARKNILSNCEKKIENKNGYGIIYKMIHTILSDLPDIRYELDVIRDVRKFINDPSRKFRGKIYRYELSDNQLSRTLETILYELYKSYLLYLPRSKLIKHFDHIQELIHEDYYEKVVTKYEALYLNRSINETIIEYPDEKNNLVNPHVIISSTIKNVADPHDVKNTFILGELYHSDMRNTHFFKKFILEVVDTETVLGVSDNPHIGSFRLQMIDDVYIFYRIFRYKTQNGTEKVLTLKAIKDVILPSNVDHSTDETSSDDYPEDRSFLDNDWIQKWDFYKNIYFYHDAKDNSIYVEFVDFLSESAQRPLLLRMDSGQNWYFIDDDFNENKLETQNNPFMINRWIYGMPFSFVFRNGLGYKIVYLDSPLSKGKISYDHRDDQSTYHWWVNSSVKNNMERVLSEFTTTHLQHSSYYVAQIEYHSMGCIFSSVDAMRSYLLSCIMFMKVECLDTLLVKYLSLLSEKDKSHDMLIKCITEGFVNNPYTHYFQNKISQYVEHDIQPNSQEVYSIDEEYWIRLNKKIYSDKFSSNFNTYRNRVTDFKIPLKSFTQWFSLNPPESHTDVVQSFDKWFTLESNSSSNRVYIDTIVKELSLMPQTDFDKKFSDLYQNMAISLRTFNDRYEKCTIKKFFDYSKLLFKILELEYHKRLVEMGNVSEFCIKLYGQSVEQFVIDFADKFYGLLEIKVAYDVLVDISNLREDYECLEIKTIYDKINEKIVYGGNRTNVEILFEIFNGSYIRKEQHEIYNKIIDAIEKDPNELSMYYVYQLLMGKGKSSVIMPMITFRYLYAFENIFNIFIVLPSHLVNQTYRSLTEKFYPILSKIWILPLLIGRYDLNPEYSKTFEYYNQTVMKFEPQKKLFILTDTSYKSLKLNIVMRNPDNRALDHLQKNSVTIFDEFDNQYNPITSDLNLPISGTSLKFHPIISEKIQNLFVDFILDNVKHSNTMSEFINSFIDLCDQKNIMKKNIAKKLLRDKHLTMTKHSTFRMRCTVYYMFQQLIECLKMRFRKDYGFPTKDSSLNKTMIYFAVPYNSVDTPIPGSEFSDIDVCMILTILSYTYEGVRKIDVVNFVNRIKAKISVLAENISVDDIDEIFQIERSLLNLDTLSIIHKTPSHNLGTVCENIHRDLTSHAYKDKSIKFLKFYLKSEILPEINFNKTQINCSFMDVIGSDMCYYKAGFTGTVFIDLPKYYEENSNRVFVDTKSDPLSDGAMYAALLGVYQVDRSIHNFRRINMSIILDPLIELIHMNQYQILIDAGAFLRLYKKDTIIETLSTRLEKHVIYIDELDTVRIYHNRKSTPFRLKDADLDKIFYYYDNKHVIGTDIPQPYKLKGLVTVSSFNDFVEISQASFRMRNLNYGHSVNYVLHDIGDIDTNVKLIHHLFSKLNSKTKSSVKLKQIEQELKMNYRIRNYSHHQENVFNMYELFRDVRIFDKYKTFLIKDIAKDMYKNHVLSRWMIHQEVDDLVVSHWSTQLDLLLQTSIPHTISINQEKVIEVHTDKTKNIARNVDIFDTDTFSKNRSILFDPKITVSIPYKFYFSYIEWKKLRHQFSPKVSDRTGSSKKRFLVELNQKYSIYWSPLLEEDPYWTKDAWSVADMSIKRHEHYPDRYIQLLNSHNYFYVKYYDSREKDSYLLIPAKECSELLSFARQHKIRTNNIWIKDKYGYVLYPLDYNTNDVVSAKELFVSVLLGKIPRLQETFILHAYMRSDATLAHVLNIFSEYYMVNIFDMSLYQKYIITIMRHSVEYYRDKLKLAVSDGIDLKLFVSTSSFESYVTEDSNWSEYLRRILSKILVIYEDLDKIDDVLSDISKIIDKDGENQGGGYDNKHILYTLNKKKNKYKLRYLNLKKLWYLS